MSGRAHSHNGNTTRIRQTDWLDDFERIRNASLNRAVLEVEELEADTIQAIKHSDWDLKLVLPGSNGLLWVCVEFDPAGVDPVPPPERGDWS